MKSILIVAWVAASCLLACGQGGFLFDQQSSTLETDPNWGDGYVMQQLQTPWGQSFTPSYASISFIRLKLLDRNPGNNQGANLRIDLHSGSISGPLLASSSSVSLMDAARGVTDFVFPNPVSLNPEIPYYFRPLVESGDQWQIIALSERAYERGTGFNGGQPTGGDLWFREGIIVPEPGTGAVLGLGLGLLAWIRRPRAS